MLAPGLGSQYRVRLRGTPGERQRPSPLRSSSCDIRIEKVVDTSPVELGCQYGWTEVTRQPPLQAAGRVAS